MDSGNTSGSMQSSSGGDEEYDSRAESISALLSNNNNHPQNDAVHVHHQHHHHQSSMFDPLSNFFDSSRSLHPNPLLNLDMVWPKPVRSDPNSSSDLVSLIPSSTQPNFLTDNHSIQLGQTRSSLVAGSSNLPAFQIPPEMQTQTQAQTQNRSLTSSATDRNDAVIPSNGAAATATRNPKKRSRASRRAPTTVLTTDTSNFRAMVQEFTGIPAPPFTSSPFPRTRLDLFGSGSGIRSGPLDQHHHPSPASYSLLRPFAQKIQQTMPFSSSSSSPTTTSSGALNYQIQSSSAPQNSFLNIQNNPVLSFHSLLQNAPAKFPKNNNVGSASASGSGLLEHDQFALSHVNVNSNVKVNPPQQLGGLPNPPSTTTNTTTVNWGSNTDHGMGSNDNNNGNNGNNNNNNNNNSNVDEGLLLRSINGGYTANNTTGSGISNGHKLNYSASSSTDFHGSTKTEINMAARSEGMVESWICSSD